MAERIKVLHIVTRMNVGGVAVLIDNLSRNFDKTRFEVCLVTGKTELPESEFLDLSGVEYSVKVLERFHKSFHPLDDFSSFIQIMGIIRKFRPDIIHTHTSKAGLFGRIGGFISSPSAIRIHTFHGHLLVGYFGNLKLRIVIGFEKFLSFFTDVLIAMGTAVRDDLVDAGVAQGSKFRIVMPGISVPNFPKRTCARNQLELDNSKIYCTFVGRITQVKRPDRLIEVAKAISLIRTDIVFIVVGEGDLAGSVKSKANELNLPIKFLGWRKDIPTILAASDIALLVSDNEAVALALIEASQAGLPIVTTAAGSVRDIAVDGENAIVTTFEESQIAEAIIALADDPGRRQLMGTIGQNRTAELFSIKNMVEAHEAIYMELLKN